MKNLIPHLSRKRILFNLLGSAILAFGLYNIHETAHITEGGVLGFNLLLDHHFGISPSVTNLVITLLCYFFGWRMLGHCFLLYSGFSVGGFSLFYWLFSRFPPIFAEIENYPLIASVAGALFVGVGVGFCFIGGGAPTGDDALAMAVEKRWRVPVSRTYLISDLIVLGLSLTYISVKKIFFSLITVLLSGWIIGLIAKYFRDN